MARDLIRTLRNFLRYVSAIYQDLIGSSRAAETDRALASTGPTIQIEVSEAQTNRETESSGITWAREETTRTPLRQQMRDQDAELKSFSKFAYWASGLSLASLYSLLSANIGRNEGPTRALFKLCSALIVSTITCSMAMMVLTIFICPCFRYLTKILKVMRIITLGLLFTSAILGFILLLLTL